MNLAIQRYEAWRRQPGLDETLAKELLAMEGDAEKITDSFGCDLAFGTAGLRGVLGAGTNRMNIYTVARATQGLATWLAGSGLPQKVAIAYDSRINSVLFSQTAARVLAANGITGLSLPETRADAGSELCRAVLWLRRGHQRHREPQSRAV